MQSTQLSQCEILKSYDVRSLYKFIYIAERGTDVTKRG